MTRTTYLYKDGPGGLLITIGGLTTSSINAIDDSLGLRRLLVIRGQRDGIVGTYRFTTGRGKETGRAPGKRRNFLLILDRIDTVFKIVSYISDASKGRVTIKPVALAGIYHPDFNTNRRVVRRLPTIPRIINSSPRVYIILRRLYLVSIYESKERKRGRLSTTNVGNVSSRLSFGLIIPVATSINGVGGICTPLNVRLGRKIVVFLETKTILATAMRVKVPTTSEIKIYGLAYNVFQILSFYTRMYDLAKSASRRIGARLRPRQIGVIYGELRTCATLDEKRAIFYERGS